MEACPMPHTRRDHQRWARRGTTEERGYGGAHRALRERRLLLYRPGDRCVMGGEPMTWWPLTVARQHIDLPHDHNHGGYLPGLSCRRHNRAEGASRGNRARGRVRPWAASRPWLPMVTGELIDSSRYRRTPYGIRSSIWR
jgi:hypothetical protein